jgi:hypothetical protein
MGVLQFVFVKPVTALLSLALDHYGMYHEGDFSVSSTYLYLSFMNNMSVTLSLYCLGLFYVATEEPLKAHEPFYKFLCIKAIIFFSYWQACAFNILMRWEIITDVIKINELQNVLIAVEIVVAAIAQNQAFGWNSICEIALEGGERKGMLNAID